MINNIENMPSLSKRLGKRKINKIQYYNKPKEDKPNGKGRKPVILDNTVIDFMYGKCPSDQFSPTDDIIAGLSRLDHYGEGRKEHRQIPLSKRSLYDIFQCLEQISTEEIGKLLNIGKRQAQIYMKCCKVMLPLLEREMYRDEGYVDEFSQDIKEKLERLDNSLLQGDIN